MRTYLFVMARSVAADIRKLLSSRPVLPIEQANVPPQPGTVEEILNSLVVREALDSLSQTHAEVLRLARGEVLPQSQIAKRLSLPLGTVKTRIFHGMRALRIALTERGFHAT